MSTFQWASTKSKGVAVDEWLVRMMTPQWALCSSSISTWRPRRPVPRAFAERYIYVGKQSNGADGWWVDRVACHSLLTLATCSYLSGPSCHCNSRKGIWRQASFSQISRVLIKFSCLYIDLNLDKRNQAFFLLRKINSWIWNEKDLDLDDAWHCNFTHAHEIGAGGFCLPSNMQYWNFQRLRHRWLSMDQYKLDAATTKFIQTNMAKLKEASLHAFI